jgi:hypothetical protein
VNCSADLLLLVSLKQCSLKESLASDVWTIQTTQLSPGLPGLLQDIQLAKIEDLEPRLIDSTN